MIIKHKLFMISIMVSVMLLSGCASMVSGGGPTKMKIKAVPADAQLTVEGIQNGELIVLQSASMVLLNKNSDYVITAAASGYKTQSVTINRGFHGGMYVDSFWSSIGAMGGLMACFGMTQVPGADALSVAFAIVSLVYYLPLITDINTSNIWYHTPNKVDLELIKEDK